MATWGGVSTVCPLTKNCHCKVPRRLAIDGRRQGPRGETVVKARDGKITLTLKGDDQKHSKDAKSTLDDKNAKLEELKEGVL